MKDTPLNQNIFTFILLIIFQLFHTIWIYIYASMNKMLIGRGRFQRRNWKYLFLAVLVFVALYTLVKITVTPRYIFVNNDVNRNCIIPDLNPFDDSLKKFDWHPDPIQCASSSTLVYVNDEGFLRYNHTAIETSMIRGLSCVYNEVSRQMGSDDYIKLGKDIPFTGKSKVNGDFFRVKCKDFNGNNVYDVMHYQIDSQSVMKNKRISEETDDKFSVIIFGIDAVSRLAAIRKLPKTLSYLRDEMEAFEFKGYMKNGDNTFPNVVTMLTGKKAYSNELPNIDVSRDHFDKFPFIWYNYSSAGYATLFSEDYADINMFNLNKAGFDKQPTDHYIRPYWRGVKKIDLLGEIINSALMGFEDKKLNLRKTSTLCYGNTPKHILSINYNKEFIQRYSHHLRFSFTWLNELSHDYVNFLELGDNDFRSFFQWINENGHFENSFVIFLSDHGSRIDAIRNTYVGRIEERMPLLQIAVPKKIRRRYPSLLKNIQDNTKRLTTHFDLYETLVDILNSRFDRKSDDPGTAEFRPRGLSLFSPIPEYRSCIQAGIPEHYCACYGTTEIPITQPIVYKIAHFIIDEINTLLESHSDVCENLSLKEIKHAERIELNLKADGDVEFFSIFQYFQEPEKQKENRYLLLLETVPGNALLEGTVNVDNQGHYNLLGQVSRTNRYGTQSHCVREDLIRLYCFCKDSV